MTQTNYRPITSQAGSMHGTEWCGVTLGSGRSFGHRPKAMSEELNDLNNMSRGSP